MEQYTSQATPELSNPDPTPNKARRNSFWIDTLETIVMALVLFLAINAVSSRVRVENISMKPTLQPGYLLVVNKLAYTLGEPKHGDIVVFDYNGAGQEDYIKRIIGLPGDQVVVENGIVSVNGHSLTEPYIAEMPRYSGSWSVPENSYFVLGDNRNNSSDSHQWGYVSEEDLVGKAVFIYFPFNAIRSLVIPDLVQAAY
ncbi:MAG: signal peptidase I [Anaerolineaceae bacterium]